MGRVKDWVYIMKNIYNIHILANARLILPLSFSQNNMAWHVMFSYTKYETGINISHKTFPQCVWFKPHLSSLINLESLTIIFGQSVQICSRKKEKEKNNGNCKAFYITRKRKNKEYWWISTAVSELKGSTAYLRSLFCFILTHLKPLLEAYSLGLV